MSGAILLVAFIIAVALAFDYINGFHDAANSIATVVSTRVLTPMQAVAWAAFFNFVAAFGFGVQVAKTVGKGVVDAGVVDQWVILGGLTADLRIGACTQPAGEFATDVELHIGVAHQQCLRVGVDGDELDTLKTDFDHPVDGVDAPAADPDDLDDRQVILRCCHGLSPCLPSSVSRQYKLRRR